MHKLHSQRKPAFPPSLLSPSSIQRASPALEVAIAPRVRPAPGQQAATPLIGLPFVPPVPEALPPWPLGPTLLASAQVRAHACSTRAACVEARLQGTDNRRHQPSSRPLIRVSHSVPARLRGQRLRPVFGRHLLKRRQHSQPYTRVYQLLSGLHHPGYRRKLCRCLYWWAASAVTNSSE